MAFDLTVRIQHAAHVFKHSDRGRITRLAQVNAHNPRCAAREDRRGRRSRICFLLPSGKYLFSERCFNDRDWKDGLVGVEELENRKNPSIAR